MSITSPLPVLRGDKGTELRCAGEQLLLRRPDDEVRIPLAAIALVRAERRDVAVELTAPAGTEPTAYRVEGVSAVAATVFADAVNATLPERASGEEALDGAALVVTRGFGNADEEEEERGPAGLRRAGFATAVAVALLAAAVGFAGEDAGRAIATLLLGEVGVGLAFYAAPVIPDLWSLWYLPRHGITVEGRQVYRNGDTTNAYVDTGGVTRYVRGNNRGGPIRVAYHPRKPETAVVCVGPDGMRSRLGAFLTISASAAPFLYGTYRLALPALGG